MIKVYAICIAFLLYSQTFLAWGNKGHKVVAVIAKSRLSQAVIDSVDHYLQGATWEEAACWMDAVANDRTYDFMTHWHYVYIAKDKTYVELKSPNIVNELEFVIEALQNRKKYTPEKISMYLKILMHLMGDLHQPLHCGYPDDKGGNDMNVGYLGQLTTLHALWDTEIIIDKEIDEKDCFRLIKTWTPEQITSIKKAGIIDCVNECRAFLPQVYEARSKTSGKYMMTAAPIIKEELSKAGLRLEAALELVFSK